MTYVESFRGFPVNRLGYMSTDIVDVLKARLGEVHKIAKCDGKARDCFHACRQHNRCSYFAFRLESGLFPDEDVGGVFHIKQVHEVPEGY